MHPAMMELDDTIVAISSAPGPGLRAVVRLSGPKAISLAGGAFSPTTGRLEEMPGFRATDGLVRLADKTLELPARAYLFRTPRSYTRQDVVELHVPAAADVLVSELIDAGARQAEPGEFTQRAFFSGRIDLSAAEAVADVIDATSSAELQAAIATLGGRLHRICEQSASEIADVLALTEASIDLAEEDIVLDSPDHLTERMEVVADRLGQLARSASAVPDVHHAPTVVLAGRANVGKSSLLNVLSGTDRAIVSALAGTTRDVLSSTMSLGRRRSVLLLDAAGFMHARTPLDIAAHHAARNAVGRAEVILFVTTAGRTRQEQQADLALMEDLRSVNGIAAVVTLFNKADLLASGRSGEETHPSVENAGCDAILTSAVTRQGLQELREKLSQLLPAMAAGTETAALHERQRRCLLAAERSIRQGCGILRAVEDISSAAELVAVELRQSLAQLGRISGEVVTEEILGRIFSRFCVGK